MISLRMMLAGGALPLSFMFCRGTGLWDLWDWYCRYYSFLRSAY